MNGNGGGTRDLAIAALATCVPGDGTTAAARALVARVRQLGLVDGAWVDPLIAGEVEREADAPLGLVAGALGLTVVERAVIALVLAVDEDPIVARVVMELQGGGGGSARPTLALLGEAFRELLGPTGSVQEIIAGPAVATGLLTITELDAPLGARAVCMPPALSLALRGLEAAWPGAERFDDEAVALPASMVAEARRHARQLATGARTLVVRAGSMEEARAAAREVVRELGATPLFLGREAAPGTVPWLLLRRLVPVFCAGGGPGERDRPPHLPRHAGPLIVLTTPDGALEGAAATAPTWVLAVPGAEERATLWRAALGPGCDELAASLARDHRHRPARIAVVGRLAWHQARIAGAPRPSRAHIEAASWVQDGALAGLAQPVPERVADDALVTTPRLRDDLEDLVDRCRARDDLGTRLGSSIRARFHPGVRALFTGPSGTGKTLAASWLATRLGLPLYRVDHAAVTSKYVGDTEKHLARLLACAEHAEVVLLFDEADAIFGKRTEVTHANDRFANAQTNYLLQRIEAFDGIALLTTNSRAKLDEAFSRRFDALLEFAPPGTEERRALWCSHLGDDHHLSSVMLDRLASAGQDLLGGHIRQTVLKAALLARRRGRPIEFGDVTAALASEYRKLGRALPHELRGDA